MSPPNDPFALKFDSIEIDPTRAPSAAAIEHALALCAPSAATPDLETPGFYLIDDAGARFTVDRDMGVVSLLDESLLTTERGGVHGVRLRVVEPSGHCYELSMRLRITGRVPQMVGAEEFGFLADLTADLPADLSSAKVQAPVAALTPLPRVAWAAYTTHAGAAVARLGNEGSAYGALIARALPSVRLACASLALPEAPPAPAAAHADWTI